MIRHSVHENILLEEKAHEVESQNLKQFKKIRQNAGSLKNFGKSEIAHDHSIQSPGDEDLTLQRAIEESLDLYKIEKKRAEIRQQDENMLAIAIQASFSWMAKHQREVLPETKSDME